MFKKNLFIKIMLKGPLLAKIDDSLALYNDVINQTFVKRWGSHKCDKPGCGYVLVFDGGVKVIFCQTKCPAFD